MKKVIPFLLLLCFLFNDASAYAAAISEANSYLPPRCEEIDEVTLRVDLNNVIQKFLDDRAEVNFPEIVDRRWRTLNIDKTINSVIDDAVLTVRNNAGTFDRFKSSWLPDKAKELADEVARIAFNSDSLTGKLNILSDNVAGEIADKLETMSARSSTYALDCLQKFVSRQYSQIFVNIFSKKIETSEPNTVAIGDLKPDTIQYINKHKFGIAGSAILVTAITAKVRRKVVTTIADRVFQRVGERVLGRLGTGFIPFVGEIVGVVLIGSDLINSFDGALPEIQKLLKASEIKLKIEREIAETIEEEVRNDNYQIAREISNDIYAAWLDFQKDYRDALSLAGELPEFRSILTETTELSKVSLLVGIALNNMGRNQLIASIQDGSFDRALSLPESSYKIIDTDRDLSSLIDWANLAGDRLEDVVNLELYKNLSSQDLDHPLLLEILAIQDASTISKITLLSVDSIRSLLSISKPNLSALSQQLSPQDLQRLAGYLGELKQAERNQLVKFSLDDPAIIQNANVMTHIIQSQAINTAIKFWQEKKDLSLLLEGFFKLSTGNLSWRLLADKFGIPTTLFIIAFPIFLIACSIIAIGIGISRQWKKANQKQEGESINEPNAN